MPIVTGDYNENFAENFATLPMNEIGSRLMPKIEDWYRYCLDNGWLSIWRRSYDQYHRAFYTRGRAQVRGDANELTKVSVNHYRNMLQHVINMITAQRPAFDPRAANSDYKSMAQVKLAKGILDYYMRQTGLENKLKKAVEYAMVLGEGYINTDWDFSAGDDLALDENEETGEAKVKKQGDIVFKTANPLDVIRDYTARSYDECQWHIVRTFENKYDVAEEFPEYEEEIKGMAYQKDVDRDLYVWLRPYDNGDQIPVYYFYHKKSATLPEGRKVRFISDKIVLTDTPLLGGEYPLKRIVPGEMADTPFGYSAGFDTLELQKNYDSISSSITTNQEAFGVQQIAMEKGSGFSSENFGGMMVMEYNQGGNPPSAINFTKTAPELFSHLGTVEANMEKLIGINSVVRGDPQASLESGSALALVKQTAVDFNSMLEQTYTTLIEQVGQSIVKLTQEFATTPRIALITGKSNKWYREEYTGEDISQIERVIVDRGNPMAKTLAGKIQMADTLMDRGMIKIAEEYIQVIETGRLEPIIEGDQAEMMLIKDENERLSNGEEIVISAFDMHVQHIKEHKTVLASTEARSNEDIVAVTTMHIQEHIDQLKTMDPQVLMMFGQQPIQPPPPPMPGEEPMPMSPDGAMPGMNNAAMENPDLPDLPEPAQPPQI
jgi:hypothetical protein